MNRGSVRCADCRRKMRRFHPRIEGAGEYDLIVFSEVLYFLSDADKLFLARKCRTSLRRDGEILLAKWLGRAAEGLCSGGDAIHRDMIIIFACDLVRLSGRLASVSTN
jgi:hypothetical protein